MSSPFTGKSIREVYYTNESHDTIQIVYNDNDDLSGEPDYVVMYIPATDPNNYDLKNLFAEGYDFDRIQLETIDVKQREAAMYRAMVRRAAEAEIQRVKTEFDEKLDQLAGTGVINSTNILKAVMDYNTDEEALFRTKLAVFELESVKSVADKQLKQQIRTSKSLLELFKVLSSVI